MSLIREALRLKVVPGRTNLAESLAWNVMRRAGEVVGQLRIEMRRLSGKWGSLLSIPDQNQLELIFETAYPKTRR